jgi:hypothetical protein
MRCAYLKKKKEIESEKILSIYVSRPFHVTTNGKREYTDGRLAAK